MKKILVGLGCLSLVTVVFALTARDRWWIRIFDYPREQITLVSILLLGLSIFFLDWRKTWVKIYLALLALGVGYQIYVLAPYTFLWPVAAPEIEAVNEAQSFRLLVSNVKMTNREADSYLELIEQSNPDVILVIEPDAWWNQQLQTLEETYAYTVEYPQDNYYGLSLYSRFPLQETEVYFFVFQKTPSIYAILTLPSGQQVSLYGLHPRPPTPENPIRPADREILRVARRVEEATLPVVVAGDFNDVPWSYTVEKFEEIGELRDLRVGRGFYNTFDSHSPILRTPIDHIFISEELDLVQFERLPAYSSDHFALLATLAVTAE